MRTNTTIKSWSSRYRTSKTTKNAQINQEKLLVARNMKWYQEICSRMPIKQSSAHKECKRTLSIENTSRTIVRD